jgi:hypothetical protein
MKRGQDRKPAPAIKPLVRTHQREGEIRNASCACGSNRPYKKCCAPKPAVPGKSTFMPNENGNYVPRRIKEMVRAMSRGNLNEQQIGNSADLDAANREVVDAVLVNPNAVVGRVQVSEFDGPARDFKDRSPAATVQI